MLRLGTSSWSSRLTTGTQYGPMGESGMGHVGHRGMDTAQREAIDRGRPPPQRLRHAASRQVMRAVARLISTT